VSCRIPAGNPRHGKRLACRSCPEDRSGGGGSPSKREPFHGLSLFSVLNPNVSAAQSAGESRWTGPCQCNRFANPAAMRTPQGAERIGNRWESNPLPSEWPKYWSSPVDVSATKVTPGCWPPESRENDHDNLASDCKSDRESLVRALLPQSPVWLLQWAAPAQPGRGPAEPAASAEWRNGLSTR